MMIFFIIINFITIILIVLFIFLNIPFIKIKSKIKYEDDMTSDICSYLDTLGVNVNILGKIGSNKSTLLKVFSHYQEINFSNKIDDEMSKIELIFNFVDFNLLKKIIVDTFDSICLSNEDYHLISYQDKINVVNDIINICIIPSGFYNDFLNNYDLKKLMYYYVDDFYIKYYRKSNILSTMGLYSWNSNSFATFLNDETIDIKLNYKNECFYIDRYSILITDEKSLKKGNIKSMSINERNKGGKELKILSRNGFRESIKWFSARQFKNDEISNERPLSNDNLVCIDSKIINPYSYLYEFFNKRRFKQLNKIQEWFYKKSKYNKNFQTLYRGDFNFYVNSSNNKYRDTDRFFMNCLDFLNSMGYKKCTIRDYVNLENFGSSDETTYTTSEICFPLWVVYGTYDSYEYECVVDELRNNSKYSWNDIPTMPIFKNSLMKSALSSFLYEIQEKELEKERIENKKKGVEI